MSDAVAYNLRDEESDKQAVETPANTSEVKTTDYQSEKSHSREEKTTMQNGHPGESEFRSPGNGEESSSGAHHDVEALKRDHAPTVEREEDEDTQEITYTAEVGKIPDDGAAGASGGKMLLMAAHPQLAQDVRAAFAGIPRVKPQWSDSYLKIMIVGESGLGKTTFIKNLLAPYAQDPNLAVNDAPGTEEVLTAFAKRPERMCTSVVVNDHSTLTSFHYSVQDTPGYNTLEDARAPIIEYIRRQNRLHCEREQDAKRAGPLHRHPDARVDVALFFVAPHRLRPIDVDFIVELSAWVPVVPIVAKADSMTVEELHEFRADVREKLGNAGKACRRDLLHAFSEETLDAANARRDVPPFAVVSSTTMDLSVGRFWPVRKYPWGTCEALSSVHSDVGSLKRLLFEEGFEELKAATERRYYTFRSQHLIGGDDPSLPIQHGNFVQHVYRFVRHKHSGERQRVKQALGNGLKVIGAAAILYVGASYALGGQERVIEDLQVLQEKGAEAAEVVLEKAKEIGAVTAEKAQDVGSVVADKVLEKADVVTDVAAAKTQEVTSRAAWFSRRKGRQLVGAAADKVGDIRPLIAEKASQVKGAVVDKFTSEEELERRRLEAEAEEEAARKEAEAAERAKHRWGPFGLFRK